MGSVLLLWWAGGLGLGWALSSCWGGQGFGMGSQKSTLAAPVPGTERAVLPPVLLTGLFQLPFHNNVLLPTLPKACQQ